MRGKPCDYLKEEGLAFNNTKPLWIIEGLDTRSLLDNVQELIYP